MPPTHRNPAKTIKDQNVVSSEISSPVSLVWGGRARLVYVRFSWVFPLQVCQHTAWYKVDPQDGFDLHHEMIPVSLGSIHHLV